MGQSPVVPDHLSDEGKDFLSLMFVHQPGERAEAQVTSEGYLADIVSL